MILGRKWSTAHRNDFEPSPGCHLDNFGQSRREVSLQLCRGVRSIGRTNQYEASCLGRHGVYDIVQRQHHQRGQSSYVQQYLSVYQRTLAQSTGIQRMRTMSIRDCEINKPLVRCEDLHAMQQENEVRLCSSSDSRLQMQVLLRTQNDCRLHLRRPAS